MKAAIILAGGLAVVLVLNGESAEPTCPGGYRSYQLPPNAALYGGDSLREGAASVGTPGEKLCIETEPSSAERRSEALGPRRVIRADQPDVILTISESNLSGPRSQEASTGERAPASERKPSREHTVLGDIKDPDRAASCGSPNLPSFDTITEVKEPYVPPKAGIRSYVTTTIPDSTPWDNDADLNPQGRPRQSTAPITDGTSVKPVTPPVAAAPPSGPPPANAKDTQESGTDSEPAFKGANLKEVSVAMLRDPGPIESIFGAALSSTRPSSPSQENEGAESSSSSNEKPAEADSPHKPPRGFQPGLIRSLSGSRGLDLLIKSLAEKDRREEFLESLQDAQDAVQDAAAADESALSGLYQDITLEEAGERLAEAERTLDLQSQQITEGKSTLPEGEKIRFSQTYRNAAEKARIARQFTEDLDRRKKAAEEQAKTAGNNPVLNFLLSPSKTENPLAFSNELAELLGRKPAPTSHDGLTQRLMLLNGLPPEKKKAAQKKMKLSEPSRFTLKNQGTVEIPLLHNGYFLGGGTTGLDCSSFVSAALPVDIRKGRFTTWDFRTMWAYRRTGVTPKDPKYESKRLDLVLSTARAFDALDLYRGEEPGIGDLLVHRLPWEATGHVFVVRDYHRDTKIASVIEAAQSAGTIREREFPLSLDPLPQVEGVEQNRRAIRPGLMVLRLKPVRQQACSIKKANDAFRGPASLPQAEDGTTPPAKLDESPPVKGGGW
jgi:hypothetical protein